MDIWDWVTRVHGELGEQGHQRLSQLVRMLPGAVCDNEHARVDALYPEALALSRAASHPWLEVFVRHWNLQSRILHRHQIEDWMGEAVSLIEFANRPETRDCPQSICVTQDLVNCYGNRDGPGFADERIAASRETLARIDATWPCYCCIGGELVEALVDAGRPEEALAELDRLEGELARTEEWQPEPMGESRVAVLRVLGRLPEALALIDRLMDDPDDEDSRLARRVERARVLGLMKPGPEAVEALPEFALIDGTHSLYRSWAEAVAILVRSGALPNEWQLERRLRGMTDELARNGVVRHGLHLCLIRTELALARGRLLTAERALATGRALVPQLRAALDGPALLDRWTKALAEARAAREAPLIEHTDEIPDDLAELLGEDPEADLERLLPLIVARPQHQRLAVAAAIAWQALGELDQSEALLRAQPADGDDPQIRIQLGRVLQLRGDWTGLAGIGDALSADPDPDAQLHGRRFRFEAARALGDTETMLALQRAAVEADPDDGRAVMILAEAQAGTDPEAALATLEQFIARGSDPGPWDWRRILIATRLGRWDAVRRASARLGMQFETDIGPIDEAWELARIRFEDDGADDELWARRTGPVTARILSIEGPEQQCRFGDEVIFDPQPVDGDADDDEPLFTYRCVEVRSAGGFRAFVLDAGHPGEHEVEALSEELEALGGELRDVTGDHYAVTDSQTERSMPGLYARMAVPADRLAAVDDLLAAVCAGWPGPAVWPELLDALGARARAKAQRAVMQRWGM